MVAAPAMDGTATPGAGFPFLPLAASRRGLALRCLRRFGIRRTTVAGVADEAGVSRAGLYKHFPDKAALLGAALVRLEGAVYSVWTRTSNSRRPSGCTSQSMAVTGSPCGWLKTPSAAGNARRPMTGGCDA